MKLIIDINDLDYETIKEVDELGGSWKTDIASQTMKAIANGRPLSEVKAEIEKNRDRDISGSGNIADWLDGYRTAFNEALVLIDGRISGKETK